MDLFPDPLMPQTQTIVTAVATLPDNRLVGLVVRRPPRERKIPGSNPACDGIFFGVESYQ